MTTWIIGNGNNGNNGINAWGAQLATIQCLVPRQQKVLVNVSHQPSRVTQLAQRNKIVVAPTEQSETMKQ